MVRARCTRNIGRGVAVVILALIVAPAASAKVGIVLSLASERPGVRDSVTVVLRTEASQGSKCRMRLLAVAPGVGKYKALNAFVIGGYSVSGPQGSTFHPLEPTRRMGFLRNLTRVGPRTWHAAIRFPRAGKWRLIVPNWCASGYAATPPVDRVVTVR